MKRRGLSGSPEQHELEAKDALNAAIESTQKARAAVRCESRVNNAIDALRAVSEFRTEMRWTSRSSESGSMTAEIVKQAKDIVRACLAGEMSDTRSRPLRGVGPPPIGPMTPEVREYLRQHDEQARAHQAKLRRDRAAMTPAQRRAEDRDEARMARSEGRQR